VTNLSAAFMQYQLALLEAYESNLTHAV